MHQSFVTEVPSPRIGQGIAGHMYHVFTFALSSQCRINAGVLIYLGKHGSGK